MYHNCFSCIFFLVFFPCDFFVKRLSSSVHNCKWFLHSGYCEPYFIYLYTANCSLALDHWILILKVPSIHLEILAGLLILPHWIDTHRMFTKIIVCTECHSTKGQLWLKSNLISIIEHVIYWVAEIIALINAFGYNHDVTMILEWGRSYSMAFWGYKQYKTCDEMWNFLCTIGNLTHFRSCDDVTSFGVHWNFTYSNYIT